MAKRGAMGTLAAIARLTRIEHSAMLVLAVLAAELLAGPFPAGAVLYLSLLTPILISMGAFAINDYFDVEADRRNGFLDRPIVSGAISRKGALWVATACLVIGPLASVPINLNAFLIAAVFSILAFLYSYRLKDIALVGNAYVALSMVIPFLYGSFVSSNGITIAVVVISFVAFLSGLGREVHGTIRDLKGDTEARKAKTVAYYMGAERASLLAFVLYFEAVLISIYMFFYVKPFAYNLVYLVPTLLVDLLLLYVATGYVVKRDRRFFSFARNASLLGMAVAILVYMASALVFLPL